MRWAGSLSADMYLSRPDGRFVDSGDTVAEVAIEIWFPRARNDADIPMPCLKIRQGEKRVTVSNLSVEDLETLILEAARAKEKISKRARKEAKREEGAPEKC